MNACSTKIKNSPRKSLIVIKPCPEISAIRANRGSAIFKAVFSCTRRTIAKSRCVIEWMRHICCLVCLVVTLTTPWRRELQYIRLDIGRLTSNWVLSFQYQIIARIRLSEIDIRVRAIDGWSAIALLRGIKVVEFMYWRKIDLCWKLECLWNTKCFGIRRSIFHFPNVLKSKLWINYDDRNSKIGIRDDLWRIIEIIKFEPENSFEFH